MANISEESTVNKNKRLCACGCGLEVTGWNYKLKQPHRFVHGHHRRGKVNPNSIHYGKENNMWKDDNVGYGALHEWVRRHLLKPKLCQICNIKPPKHLANVTGKYARDFDNWEYLCVSCHYKLDFSRGIRESIMKGKHHSYKTRIKISEAKKGIPNPLISIALMGRHLSKEHRKNISEGVKRRWV